MAVDGSEDLLWKSFGGLIFWTKSGGVKSSIVGQLEIFRSSPEGGAGLQACKEPPSCDGLQPLRYLSG